MLIGKGLLAACVAVVFTARIAQHLPGGTGATVENGGASHGPAPDREGHISDPAISDQLIALRASVEQLRAEIADAAPALAQADNVAQAEFAGLGGKATAATPDRAPEASSIEQELERAAYLIVYQADRYHRELDLPESAIASYRETIELFPRTRAAQTARVRLAELGNEKGSQS